VTGKVDEKGLPSLAKQLGSAMDGVLALIEAEEKTQEARGNLWSMQSGVKNAVYESKKHVFPPSAGPVPLVVPKGVTYQSSAKDWSAPTWQAIKFQVTDPQRYQYEIVTAKDGKTCVLRARGDLDGDGVTSVFEIKMRMDGDDPKMDGTINEQDPTE
jgi:hypothetical protein